MKFDWDLIVSSFAQQYGIRLHYEYENISCQEFRQLLSNINGDTPLGNTVRIRSEKNAKKIHAMTPAEKKIRQDWLNFKRKQHKQNVIELKKEDISKVLGSIFK